MIFDIKDKRVLWNFTFKNKKKSPNSGLFFFSIKSSVGKMFLADPDIPF